MWYYPYRKLEQAEILSLIRSRDHCRAGWVLTAYGTSDWQWCLVIGYDGEKAGRIEHVRDCSEEEKTAFPHLLWPSQSGMRVRRVRTGDPWVLACIN